MEINVTDMESSILETGKYKLEPEKLYNTVCGVVSGLSYIGSGNSYRYTLFKNFYLFRIPF